MAVLNINRYDVLSCIYDEDGYPNGNRTESYIGTITQGSNNPFILSITFSQDIPEDIFVGLSATRPDGSTYDDVMFMTRDNINKRRFLLVLTQWFSRYYGALKLNPVLFKGKGNVDNNPILTFRPFYINIEKTELTKNQQNGKDIAPDVNQYVATALPYPEETNLENSSFYVNKGGVPSKVNDTNLKNYINKDLDAKINKNKDDIAQLQCDINYNRIGLLDVSEYNTDTGEITYAYNPSVINNMEYNDNDGLLTIYGNPIDWSCDERGVE